MTFEFKRLAAALAFATMGAAHADALVVKNGGATFNGTATLAFSADMMGALDTGHMSVATYSPATSVIEKDTDGYYVNVSSTAPMRTLTLDDQSLVFQGMSSVGGLTVTAPLFKSISSGGSLTITDIATDLSTKTVYASLIGANGVGTLTNVAMWTFDTLEGPIKYGQGNSFVNDIHGLRLTADGRSKWSQALGLVQLGQVELDALTDFGSLHTVINFTQVCDTSYGTGCGGPTPSIPEPASPVLMGLGLGLLGMAMSARRQRA
jgi:hypothetical protein